MRSPETNLKWHAQLHCWGIFLTHLEQRKKVPLNLLYGLIICAYEELQLCTNSEGGMKFFQRRTYLIKEFEITNF